MATAARIAVASAVVAGWLTAASTLVLLPPWAALAAVAALCAGVVWLHIVRAGREPARAQARGLRAPRPGAGLLVGAALAVAALAAAAAVLMDRYAPVPDRPDYFEPLARAGGWAAMAALQAGFAPLLEELIFRGWIQGALRERMRAAPAIALTALLFGAVHGSWTALPFFTAVGVLFGAAAWAWRSVWAAIALHVAFNASQLLLEALEKAHLIPPLASLATPPLVLWAVGALALALGLLARAAPRAARLRDPSRGAGAAVPTGALTLEGE